MRDAAEPVHSVTAQGNGRTRAFIVPGGNAKSETFPIRMEDEPSITVTNHSSAAVREMLEMGRVVKITPRALARFQSVPDSYILPPKAALACTVIGNGVPCLLVEKIVRELTDSTPRQ